MSYLDTSIIVAYYCTESISERCEKIIIEDREPMISSLTVVEVASAISRKIREKFISSTDAVKLWHRFDYHRSQSYFIFKSLEARHFDRAVSFITQFKTPLRALDALHLAIALEYSDKLITSDIHLAQSGKQLGIPVVLIR